MFIAIVYYIEGPLCVFGPFDTIEQAEQFGLDLMARERSMVASFKIEGVHKP